MRSARVGVVVGGLGCLVVTPWFALAYYSAHGTGLGETPPLWSNWIDWPTLITGDKAVDVYNRYGIIFGIGVGMVVLSLITLVRHSTAPKTRTRRSCNVILAGMGAVGSLLEYGFGGYVDASFGFFAELLGFLTMTIGTGLLGWSLRKEADLDGFQAVLVGISGFSSVLLGHALIDHISSGPAFPFLASVVFIGLSGMPRNVPHPIEVTHP